MAEPFIKQTTTFAPVVSDSNTIDETLRRYVVIASQLVADLESSRTKSDLTASVSSGTVIQGKVEPKRTSTTIG